MAKKKPTKQPPPKKPRLEPSSPPLFVSAAAEEHYHQHLAKRGFLYERGFLMTDATDMGLQAMVHTVISAHNWQKFCQHPGTVVVPLVREFCANMTRATQLLVTVRGVRIPVSPSDINGFYGLGLRELPDDYFRLVKSPTETFLQEVLTRICIPDTTWDVSPTGCLSLNHSKLLPDARVWLKFLQSRLLPTSHLYNISRDRAILLFCVLEGRPLDVGRIIYSELYLSASLDSISCRICFPALISGLCLNRSVPFEDWEEQVQVPSPLTRRTVSRIIKGTGAAAAQLDDEERPEHFPSTSRAPPSSSAARASSGTADAAALLLQRFDHFETTQQARLDQLERNQQVLLQLVQHLEHTTRELRQYIKDRDHALEHSLRSTSQPSFTFPLFPDSVLQAPPPSSADAPAPAAPPASVDHHSEGSD